MKLTAIKIGRNLPGKQGSWSGYAVKVREYRMGRTRMNFNAGEPVYWPHERTLRLSTCHDEQCPDYKAADSRACVDEGCTIFDVVKRRGHRLMLEDIHMYTYHVKLLDF